jgi:hypothetical protein
MPLYPGLCAAVGIRGRESRPSPRPRPARLPRAAEAPAVSRRTAARAIPPSLPALRGKDAGRHTAGVSFNWNKICGCVEPDESDPIK